MERAYRVRRSCLAAPASSERFIEKARGLPVGRTGIEAQIEDAAGLAAANAIAAASRRLEALVFGPADYSRAAAIIEADAQATTVQARGAVMLGDEMIDEASRKMAEAVMARGNAAGFTPG